MKKVSLFFPLLLAALCSCEQQSITRQEPTTATDQVAANITPATLEGTAVNGLSQVKYSFDEVSYGPGATGVSLCLYSSGITNTNGSDKYYVTAWIDLQKKTIANPVLREYGNPGKVIPLNKITHVSHLYLGTPNTGGVEAYACRGAGTNMVFYYLVGATTPNTVKFLFYLPSGPNEIQLGS